MARKPRRKRRTAAEIALKDLSPELRKRIQQDTEDLRKGFAPSLLDTGKSMALELTVKLDLLDQGRYFLGWDVIQDKDGARLVNRAWHSKHIEYGRPVGLPVSFAKIRGWVGRKLGIARGKRGTVAKIIKAKIEANGIPGKFVLANVHEKLKAGFTLKAVRYLRRD